MTGAGSTTAAILAALAALLAIAAGVLLLAVRFRLIATRGTRFAVVVALWIVGAAAGNSCLLVAHVVTAGGWWRAVAIALLLISVASGALVIRRLHPRWLQMLCDAWLIGGGVLALCWVLALLGTGAEPTVDDLLDLGVLALTVLNAIVTMLVVPGRVRERASTIRLQSLRLAAIGSAVAVGALLVRSITNWHPPLVVAAVLLVAANLALAVSCAVRSDLRLAASKPQSTGFDRYVPVLVGLTTMIGTLGLLAFGPSSRGTGAYLLLCLVALALGVRQVITARESAGLLHQLGLREEHYRNLVHRSTDVILICSLDSRIEYASPAALTILDIEPTKAVGRSLGQVLGVTDATVRATIATAGEIGGPATIEGALLRPGTEIHLETLLSVVDGRIVCNIRDVTERAVMQAQLRELAYDDALTGLPNRARILEMLHSTVEAARKGAIGPAVLFIDLDGFKNVNDAGGHAAGDAVLVEVGSRLSSVVPADCHLGRLGGDEFVVVVPDADRQPPGELAERIMDLVRRPYGSGPAVFVIGASVGVARFTGSESAETLLQNADLAVYQAKRNRRGWVTFVPAMHDAAVAKAALDAELAQALADNRLLLHYQPIIDLTRDQVVGAEALLRWVDATGRIRAPEAMLEFADRTGVASTITRWVVREAIAQAARWASAGLPIRTAINLTPTELRDPDLLTDVLSTLFEFSVAPSELVLEITEQALVDVDEVAKNGVRRIAEAGVLIAIDDFGTGYSSLQYLMDLPVGAIKIDREFTARLGTSARAEVLVSEIIRTACRLGVRVVAEGIETPAQRDHLVELGAVMGQGFLFAKALPAEQLADMARVQGVGRIPTPTDANDRENRRRLRSVGRDGTGG